MSAKTGQIRFDKSPNSDIGNSELVVGRSSDGATPNHTLCNPFGFHTNRSRVATGNICILRVERDIRLDADDEGLAVVVLGDTLDTHVQITRSLDQRRLAAVHHRRTAAPGRCSRECSSLPPFRCGRTWSHRTEERAGWRSSSSRARQTAQRGPTHPTLDAEKHSYDQFQLERNAVLFSTLVFVPLLRNIVLDANSIIPRWKDRENPTQQWRDSYTPSLSSDQR